LFTFDENFGLTKTTAGTEATVTVSGDFGESDELVLVSVMEKALSIICKKPFDVPQEEMVSLYRVTVEPTVGTFSATDVLTFRLSKGFEFVQVPTGAVWEDEDTFTISGITGDSLIFETGTIVIEATTAEIGDVAILSVFCDGYNSAAVEVAEVIKPTVLMSVDEDEDIPEFYSGTSTNNIGLTDDSDHISLAVNLRETWVGEWVSHKPFTLTLPEGVYVTDVSVEGNMAGGANGTMTQAELEDWFRTAYTKGEYKNFTFAKDTWEDTVTGDSRNDIDFTLKLVATPSFVGDVTLTLESTAFDTQEVVIARFIAPYTVETAETTSSELNKTVPVADIVVEEAAPGLWEEGSTFLFDFDNTLPTFVNSGYMLSSNNQTSQIEVSAPTDAVGFTVHEESVKRAAVVTLSDLKATTPAEGDKYGLYLNTSATEAFLQTRLYSASGTVVGDVLTNGSAHLVEKNYLAVTPGAAEEVLPFRFEVSKESGLAGKTVELKIDMAGNPGIIAACMEISYDADKLTLLEVTDTGLLNDYTSSPTLDTNPYKLRWEDALAENNMQTGTIAVLKFQIKENCEPGIVPVYLELSEDEIFNTALELVPASAVNGHIEVIEYIPGDANSDGKVNAMDSTLLRRYLAKWDNIQINTDAMDVNADGNVDTLDVTILRRYLAGWPNISLKAANSLNLMAVQNDPILFSVSDVSGVAGEEVKVTISMENNPGIITACMELAYDSDKLELLRVEDSGLLDDFIGSNRLDVNPYALRWENSMSTVNNTEEGVIATLTFR
ncbi:MAG: hypothetical protein IKY38_00555, partial [Anaerotignum sp.]|nr:hypothetical protein [Anaerotignum sp.]